MISLARKVLGPILPYSVRVAAWKLLLRLGYDGRAFLLELLPRTSVAAEIGVWEGDFSSRILRVVKPTRLHLIDPWRFNVAYPARAYGGGIARNQNDMDAVHDRVKERFADRPEVVIHRATSGEAVAEFADDYFDWIYIDGDHSEEAVYRDLSLYLPKVKVGGYLAGDDYDWTDEAGNRAVKAAVERFLADGLAREHLIAKSQFVIARLPTPPPTGV